MLFGSLARGEETEGSDVDIEVVSEDAQEWEFRQTEQRYGIPIDLVICPKDHLLDQVERYPYLCYEYLRERIIYDPDGFMTRIRDRLEPYFDNHPEIVAFWEEKLRIVRENKARGEDAKNAVESYDEAEILFSDEHRVTRDFFRS
jgi:predicted nucleotidyltransferase